MDKWKWDSKRTAILSYFLPNQCDPEENSLSFLFYRPQFSNNVHTHSHTHFFWHQRLRPSIYGHFSSHILNICGIFSRWLQTKGYIFLSSLVTHVKPPRRHPAMNNKDKIWSDHSFCFVISCSHMKIKQTLSQVVALLTMIKKNTKKHWC